MSLYIVFDRLMQKFACFSVILIFASRAKNDQVPTASDTSLPGRAASAHHSCLPSLPTCIARCVIVLWRDAYHLVCVIASCVDCNKPCSMDVGVHASIHVALACMHA